ncbi:MAG: GNAT family N-acetyltransferase [Dehalococcoidia bacterium]|nr:GNAT family N-acetyltransferase [Dehalococcoidia bacterium]
MSRTLTLRRARESEAPAIAGILAQAFAADPVFEWALPDLVDRPQYTRAFFDVFTGFVFEAGEVHTDDAATGAALWLPFDPAAEAEDDGSLGKALAAAIGPHIERMGIIDELMKAAHPQRPHAYLPFIGVVPAGQGQGIGASLLARRTAELDGTGQPAYLEATTVESARLYARHGFRTHGPTIDLPGGPSMIPMWRDPAR